MRKGAWAGRCFSGRPRQLLPRQHGHCTPAGRGKGMCYTCVLFITTCRHFLSTKRRDKHRTYTSDTATESQGLSTQILHPVWSRWAATMRTWAFPCWRSCCGMGLTSTTTSTWWRSGGAALSQRQQSRALSRLRRTWALVSLWRTPTRSGLHHLIFSSSSPQSMEHQSWNKCHHR